MAGPDQLIDKKSGRRGRSNGGPARAGDDRAPLEVELEVALEPEHDSVWVGAAEGPRALNRSDEPAINELFARARSRLPRNGRNGTRDRRES